MASTVDLASIMVAYTIGVTQSDFVLGIAYGVFDAFLVVWLRKPIFRAVQRVVRFCGVRSAPKDKYVADI